MHPKTFQKIINSNNNIIIDKFNIFGEPLKPFYKEYGSGFLGGASVVFTILVYKFMVYFVKDF